MTVKRDPRGFPIQQESRRAKSGSMEAVPAIHIPWSVAEVAFGEYARRYPSCAHQQPIERLAQRGGFGRDELLMFLAGAAEHEHKES